MVEVWCPPWEVDLDYCCADKWADVGVRRSDSYLSFTDDFLFLPYLFFFFVSLAFSHCTTEFV